MKYFLLVQTLLTWIWWQAPHCLLFVYLSSLLGKGDCRGWEFIATQIENTEQKNTEYRIQPAWFIMHQTVSRWRPQSVLEKFTMICILIMSKSVSSMQYLEAIKTKLSREALTLDTFICLRHLITSFPPAKSKESQWYWGKVQWLE